MISSDAPTTGSPEQLQRLWTGVRRRDRESFTSLYRLMYADLINFGMLFGHDGAAAKDAINQIFLELWERGEALATVENVRSYLITYLRRKLLREYERSNRFAQLTDTEPLAERSYEDMLVKTQQDEHARQRLQAALAQLTPRQKELIEMRFFRNLTNEAISQATGMHINTVYNTMSSALKTLRQTFRQDDHSALLSICPLLLYLLFEANGGYWV